MNSNRLSAAHAKEVVKHLVAQGERYNGKSNKKGHASFISRMIPNAEAAAEAAMKKAVGVVTNRAKDFAKYALAFCRVVNQDFGKFSRQFKAMWIMDAMVSYVQHCNCDHGNCDRFMWWTKFTRSDQYYVPDKMYIRDFSSDGNPPNTDVLINTLFLAWINSPRFEQCVYSITLYARTGPVESFNRCFTIRCPKLISCGHDHYWMKLMATYASFNWQQEWKVLDEGVVVRRSKYHVRGVLTRQQHKPLLEAPTLDMVDAILSDQCSHIAASVKEARDKLAAIREVREEFVREKEAANDPDLIRALKATSMGASKLEQDDGELLSRSASAAMKPRPRMPHPSRPDDLLFTRKQKEALVKFQNKLMTLHPDSEVLKEVAGIDADECEVDVEEDDDGFCNGSDVEVDD